MAGQNGGIGTKGLAALAAAAVALLGGGVWYSGMLPKFGGDPAALMAPEAAEGGGTASAPDGAAIPDAEDGAKPEAAADTGLETETADDAVPETEAKPEAETAEAVEDVAPTFDVVRVETNGSALVAGAAAPGARVEFLLDGAPVGEAVADGQGKFAAFLTLDPSTAPRVLTMMSETGERKVASEEEIILAPLAEPRPDIVVADVPAVTDPAPAQQESPAVAEGTPTEAAAATAEDTSTAAASEAGTDAASGTSVGAEVAATEARPTPEESVPPVEQASAATDADNKPTVAAADVPVARDAGTDQPVAPEVSRASTEPAAVAERVAEATSAGTAADQQQVPQGAAQEAPQPVDSASAPVETRQAGANAPAETDEPATASPATDHASATSEGGQGALPAPAATADVSPAPSEDEQPASAPEPAVAAAQPEPAPAATGPSEAPPTADEPAAGALDGTVTASAEPAASRDLTATAEQPRAAVEPAAVTAPPVEEPKVAEARTNSPVPSLVDRADAPRTPTAGTEASGIAGSAPAPVQAPEATSVAVLKATKDGVELIQPAAPERPEAMAQLALDTISYSAEGEVQLAGRAGRESVVRVYLDNRVVAEIAADDGGKWKGELNDIAPGIYTLRLDSLNAGGKVIGRIETPFKREPPEVLNPPRQENLPDQAPLIRAVTVQKGDTLWAISRERYGNGILYVRVFEANRENIRNPDLIYPGQVFSIP